MFQDIVSHKGCRKIRLLNYRIVSFSDIWMAKVYISWSMILILDFIWIWFQICIFEWRLAAHPPSEAAPSLLRVNRGEVTISSFYPRDLFHKMQTAEN